MNIYLLDIDGVLADFVGAFCDYYNKLGLNKIEKFDLKRLPVEKQIGKDEKTYKSLKHLFRVTGAECLSPKPITDSIKFTKKAKARGDKIIIWTSRPIDRYPKCDIWTKHWLDKFGFEYDKLRFVERGFDKEMFFLEQKDLMIKKFSKDVIVHAVDDRPLYKELGKFVDKMYIFDQPYNRKVKSKHLKRIKSLLEIL